MSITIILTTLFIVLVSRDLFNLPDVKPFNCLPCFSFWVSVLLSSAWITYVVLIDQFNELELTIDIIQSLTGSYLATVIFIKYEQK